MASIRSGSSTPRCSTSFDDTHAGIFLLNTTLFTIVIGALIQPVLSGAASDSLPRISDLYAVIVAAALLVNPTTIMFNQLFASPGNDLPGALLLVYAFWAFLRIFEADRDKEAWLLQLLVAGVLAVMTKIATAPGLLLLPIAGYAVFARDPRRVWGLARNPILLCLVTVGAAWMATGIISSGCIAFPAGSTCIAALPWTPPLGDIADFATLVTAWARLPNAHVWEAAHGWAWLKDWPSMMLARRIFIPGMSWSLALAAGIGVALALVERVALKSRRQDRSFGPGPFVIGYAIVIGCLGNLFWFLAAPDPRFGIGFLLALPALVIAAATRALAADGAIIRLVVNRIVLMGFVFVCVGLFLRYHRLDGLEGGGVMAVDSRCPGLSNMISARSFASTSPSAAINAGTHRGPAPRAEAPTHLPSPIASCCFGSSSNQKLPPRHLQPSEEWRSGKASGLPQPGVTA